MEDALPGVLEARENTAYQGLLSLLPDTGRNYTWEDPRQCTKTGHGMRHRDREKRGTHEQEANLRVSWSRQEREQIGKEVTP